MRGNMKLSLYRLTAAVLSIAVLITVFPAKAVKADTRRYTEEELQETIDGIIEWCREEYGAAGDETLFGERYLSGAGTSGCDWYPIGMSRSGWEEDYSLYLEALTAQVKERYKEEDKLDAAKATEWHRITLAVLACGGDPTALTYDESGAPINLIADGVYNRGLTENLGKQGINGWIWGLIALDSMRYEVPQGAYYTRDDIITQILCAQLDDGGYDLAAASADPDMTAMAIQALAPYYHSSKEYTYTRKGQEEPQTRTVRQVIDEATETLSRLQDEEGGYSSWGMANVESADQVLVALCSIGVDPQSDERFIKNGNTILDSVMSFRLEDGGFLHAKVYDEANPTSLPDESNPMAGYQTLYALTAVLRQMRGENTPL